MTEPYYRDDYVTLYYGDCLEHPEWWTGADVLVTDPPYGIKYRSRAAIGYSRRLESQPLSNDIDTAVRDLVVIMWGDERPAIVFGSWRVPKPENVLSTLIWDKGEQNGLGSMHLPWSPTHEEIYVMGQTAAKGFAQLPHQDSIIPRSGGESGIQGAVFKSHASSCRNIIKTGFIKSPSMICCEDEWRITDNIDRLRRGNRRRASGNSDGRRDFAD